MAFDAGAAVGRIILDDSQYKKGAKDVAQTNKNMGKSFFAAQIAVQAVNKALELVGQTIQKGIKVATEFTEENSKLNTVFKNITGQAGQMRNELVNSFGLSTTAATKLLGATGDLLTGFGFTQDKALDLSGEVQKLAVDLASFTNFSGGAEGASAALTKALLGERESLKSLGIAIREADIQQRLLEKGQKNLTGTALQQAKAEITLELALEQSKNAIGDYARTTNSLANRQRTLSAVTEDISLVFGKAFLPIINETVGATLEAAKGIKEFLLSAEGIEIISDVIGGMTATIEMAKEIISDFVEILRKNLKVILQPIIDLIIDLTGEVKGTNIVFDILAGIMKTVSVGLNIAAKLVRVYIQQTTDMIKIVKEAIKTIILFSQALFNPKKWKELGAQLKETGSAIKDFGKNFVENTKDVIKTAVDEFKSFPTDVKKSTRKLEKIWDKSFRKTKRIVQDSIEEIVESSRDGTDKVITSLERIPTRWEVLKEKINNISMQMKLKFDEVGQGIINQMSFVFETVGNTFNSIMSIVTQQQEQELAQLVDKHAKEIEELESQKEKKLNDKREEFATERQMLEEQLARGKITKEQFDAQIVALEERKNTELAALENELNANIEKSKSDARKKENKKQQEIFNTNKANQIANVWIQYALGIMSAWTTSIASLGPIAGSIFAGVLTAVLTGVAIAQTAVIAQQQFIPAREKGGRAGGMTRINESGGEIVNLPDGSIVVPNDISEKIAMNAGMGRGDTNISVSFAGAKIADDMSLKKITNAVIKQMGNQLRLQKRTI